MKEDKKVVLEESIKATLEARDDFFEKELEVKKKLIILRTDVIKSIKNYNKKIKQKQDELQKINEQICSLFGHDYITWEEHKNNYLDRDLEYTRECQVCGKKEVRNQTPDEYVVRRSDGKLILKKK